jgi:hypothetical protein
MLQGFGHLERHTPLAPPRPPHAAALLARLLRAAARGGAALWRGRRARESADHGVGVEVVPVGGEGAGGKEVDDVKEGSGKAGGPAKADVGAAGGDGMGESSSREAGPLTLEDVLSGLLGGCCCEEGVPGWQ